MITIYRPQRYPDHDAFEVQCSQSCAKEFTIRFAGVRLGPTKLDSKFECSYYGFLRNEYRGLYDEILEFFRSFYTPPVVYFSVFRSNEPLKPTWSADVWRQKIEDAIKGVFSSQGYQTKYNQFSQMVEVIPIQPSFIKDEIQIYYGAQYRIRVNENNFAELWLDTNFWFYRDEEGISLKEIAYQFGENSKILQEIRSLTARSSEEQFNLCKNFVNRIGVLVSCDNLTFSSSPLTAEELGFDTWFWLHDSNTVLRGAGEYPATISKALLGKEGGLYDQPNDTGVILLVPYSNGSKAMPSINWESDVVDRVQNFLEELFPKNPLPFQVFKYPLSGSIDTTIEKVQSFVQSQKLVERFLCLMPTPGKKAKSSGDSDLIEASQQTFDLQKCLRKVVSFVETPDWSDLSTWEGKYILRTALLKGLFRIGIQPWQLVDLPFDSGISPENTYFVGLDARPKEAFVSCVIVNSQGEMKGYGGRYSKEQKGFYDLLRQVVSEIKEAAEENGWPAIKHLIFHISPSVLRYAEKLLNIVHTFGFTADIVSIHQNSSVRCFQSGNIQGTPSNGLAFGRGKTAFLINTLSVGEKAKKGYKFPSPQPIEIKHLFGPSSLKTLAAQVYWLSVVHIGALHRTVDLPITLSYSMALGSYIERKKNSMRVASSEDKVLFWL